MSSTLRTLLLWGRGTKCLWTGHRRVPLQGLPLCRDQNLWHQCWSYAISGKCRRHYNAQWLVNVFTLAQLCIWIDLCPFLVLLFLPTLSLFVLFLLPISSFSGSSRWVPVRALRWATICGSHVSCCIVCVKILVLLQHWTPNQLQAIGTVLVATRMSAPIRWGKKEDCRE